MAKPTRSRLSRTPDSQGLSVKSIVLGHHIIEPWYPSFYREEVVSGEFERLYICERCFKYTKEPVLFLAHKKHCEYASKVPGRVVYEEDLYSIWEVDGEDERLFTQNLSLFAKLFIENKSVCFDVHSFLYYILVAKPTNPHLAPRSPPSPVKRTTRAAVEAQPPQIVGFFSKEKLSWDNNNLACILIFPPWQRLGLGQLLMHVSYEMAKKEGRLGGPEKPLSRLGALSYDSYWSRTLAQTLLAIPRFSRNKSPKKLSIADLSDETYIAPEDISITLTKMGVLGAPRKKDGCIKMDKAVLRRWCAQNRIGLERVVLKGHFIEYSDDEGVSSDEAETDD